MERRDILLSKGSAPRRILAVDAAGSFENIRQVQIAWAKNTGQIAFDVTGLLRSVRFDHVPVAQLDRAAVS